MLGGLACEIYFDRYFMTQKQQDRLCDFRTRWTPVKQVLKTLQIKISDSFKSLNQGPVEHAKCRALYFFHENIKNLFVSKCTPAS